jgi:two-component system response regulator
MSERISILLVEDNPADCDLIREALEDSGVPNQLAAVPDGVEALAYLRQEGRYAEALPPALILLDLNMPRMNGHEFLAELRADPEIKRIPVVVLTSSTDAEDVRSAYDRCANAYITKPVDLAGFDRIMEAIEAFWFTVVCLPPE